MITITAGKRTHHHDGPRLSMYLRFMHLPARYRADHHISRMVARRYARMYAAS